MSESEDTAVPGDAWPELKAWIDDAGNLVELIEAKDNVAKAALASLGELTPDSTLGALVRHAAALVVDDWLVILGAGGKGFPGIEDFNGKSDRKIGSIPGALVVAVDRLGGSFAVNAGGLPEGEVGEICYLAPDDLEWMACGFGHPELLEWALDGDVEGFYDGLRWPSWREESTVLRPGQGFNAFPPPWSEDTEAGPVSHAPVPLLEAWLVVLSASLGRGNWALAGAGANHGS